MTHPSPVKEYKIRSFIRRQGRITPGQQLALDKLWDNYCLIPEQACDFEQEFGRHAPLFVEIGFGNGDSLAQMAAANLEHDYIGIEVHRPGVGHLMRQLEAKNLTNVRIYCHDAIEILQQRIPDNRLSGVYLFFPDPWHKRRHHKRRIVKSEFIQLLTGKLEHDGFFHAATDWEHYAHHMHDVLMCSKLLSNTQIEGGFAPRPDYRHLTKFEKRGIRLGHGVWDLIFEKK